MRRRHLQTLVLVLATTLAAGVAAKGTKPASRPHAAAGQPGLDAFLGCAAAGKTFAACGGNVAKLMPTIEAVSLARAGEANYTWVPSELRTYRLHLAQPLARAKDRPAIARARALLEAHRCTRIESLLDRPPRLLLTRRLVALASDQPYAQDLAGLDGTWVSGSLQALRCTGRRGDRVEVEVWMFGGVPVFVGQVRWRKVRRDETSAAAWAFAARQTKLEAQPYDAGLDALLACGAAGKGARCMPGFAGELPAIAVSDADDVSNLGPADASQELDRLHASWTAPLAADACARVALTRARVLLRDGRCDREGAADRADAAARKKATPARLRMARSILGRLSSEAEAAKAGAGLAALSGRTVVHARLRLRCEGPAGDPVIVDYERYDGVPLAVSRVRTPGAVPSSMCHAIVPGGAAEPPVSRVPRAARRRRVAEAAGWSPVSDPDVAAFARCAAAGRPASCLPFADRYVEQGVFGALAAVAKRQVPSVAGALGKDPPLAGTDRCTRRGFRRLARLLARHACVMAPPARAPETVKVSLDRVARVQKLTKGKARQRALMLPTAATRRRRTIDCVDGLGKRRLEGRVAQVRLLGRWRTWNVEVRRVEGPGKPCVR